MKLGTTLLHALGVVLGFVMPGVSTQSANVEAEVKQRLADLYGDLLASLSKSLGLDPTLTGSQRLFRLVDTLVATAKRDGFKGDEQILVAAAVDVAQAAFKKTLPEWEQRIAALALSIFHTSPLAKLVESLVTVAPAPPASAAVQPAADDATAAAG